MTELSKEWSEWWVAGAAGQRAPGQISFDEANGATLTLYGLLPQMVHVRFRSPPLYGETFDGEHLTLPSAALYQQTQTVGGGIARTRTLLRANALLRGFHVSPDKLTVRRAVVQMTGLRDVCLRSWPTDDRAFMGAARRIEVAGGSLTFRQSTERQRPNEYAESAERDVDVLIEIDDGLSLSDFEEQWVNPLEGLILFAARSPVARRGFMLLLYDPDQADSMHPAIRAGAPDDVWNETPVEVLTEAPSLSLEPPAQYGRLLVPFNALGGDAEEFIRRWWDLYAKLGPAPAFLLSALGSEMFLENRFLNLMSFAESYHRRLHDKPKVPSEAHNTNTQAMLAVIRDKTHRTH